MVANAADTGERGMNDSGLRINALVHVSEEVMNNPDVFTELVSSELRKHRTILLSVLVDLDDAPKLPVREMRELE